MEDLLQVGIITSTHGISGEVKVFPTTDDAKRFKTLTQIILDTGKEKINLNIQGVKFFKNFVILKFKEYNNINDVEKFRQMPLYVTRKNAVKLDQNEYFIADLIGMSILDEENQKIGILTDVMQTGANDVYVIELDHDAMEKQEILVPAIKECILKVDMKSREMTIHLLEGLV